MQQAGGQLVKHYRDLAFMGFIEVARNLPTILKNLKTCKRDVLQFVPDTLILIDYPGFNLRIASWAKQQGIRVIYYISPQVWAWKENRVKTIKACVDKMLVILPFEKAFYKKWHYDVEYVGHPLVEVIDQFKANHQRADRDNVSTGSMQARDIVALLPGSRKQEIKKKLPVFLQISRLFPDQEFVVAQAPGQEDSFYQELLRGYPNVSSVRNQTYELLMRAKAACVTSGTATLETALFGVPEVVCYKGSAVSYQIAKRLVRVNYISLVNLIMDRPVVKELIQDDFTANNLAAELRELLTSVSRQDALQNDYSELKHTLSLGGHASANAARSIMHFLGLNVS
jgi:lipid-A-disaccharide synthase